MKKEVHIETGYLRTRDLVRRSSKAFRDAAKESMEIMGYLVMAEDGWIIKKHKDGRIEKIEKIVKYDIAFRLD